MANKTISRKETTPYQIDEKVYKRFDSRNVMFSREIWDTEYMAKYTKVQKVYKNSDPGYSHLDSALVAGALFCATLDGTMSPLMGPHVGLLSFESQTMDAPHGPAYSERWDPGEHTPEEVTAIVKKAALTLGASMVGISPFEERWIYSGYYDAMTAKGAPIVISEVKMPELPPGQVSPEEAGKRLREEFLKIEAPQFKILLLDVMETTDPSLLPKNLPPTAFLKSLPASMIKEKLTASPLPLSVMKAFIKKLGLDLEIAAVDMGASVKPTYLEDGTLQIPNTMKSIISLAFEMDYENIKASPTTLGDATAMDGYSKMAITAGALARFLMGLGYNAIPCGNNTGLSIPMAIDAGLGELGRNGLLITPKYGPRVRLAKVITDLPMAYDKPIRFGVREFCEVCGKCAKDCPVQAIWHGPQIDKVINFSNNPGVMKWPVDAEKCYFSWAAHGSGCGVCIKVCPFNKPQKIIHEAARLMVGARTGWLDQLLIKLDDTLGYGSHKPSFGFWRSRKYLHTEIQ
jgi:reductive dehalogenase